MKNLLLIVLILAAILATGCTGEQAPPDTRTLSPLVTLTKKPVPASTGTPAVTAPQGPATSPATVAADGTSPVATTPAPTPAPADGPGTLKTYTNADYGFTIRIPGSWTASGESSSLAGVTKYKVVFDDPSFTSSQYITITPGANGLPLEDWARIFSSQVTADPSRRVVSQSAIQVDGAPARKFVLVAGSGSNAFQSMIVMMVKGDNSYFMEFTSRENDYSWYSKDADEILGTFRFT